MFGPDCSPQPAGGAKAIPADVYWLDLLNPTREEERLVEAALGQNVPTRAEMQEIEPSSRLYNRGGALFMTVAMLHGVAGDEPATDPVSFILTERLLVTVRYVDPLPFGRFYAHLCAEPAIAPDALTVFLRLNEAVVDRLADELEKAGNEMDSVSSQIFAKRLVRDHRRSTELRMEAILLRIGGVQRLLAKVRESTLSASRMLGFLAPAGFVAESPLSPMFSSLVDDTAALLDHSNFLTENLVFLLDASLGLISLEQNWVMKVFSIVAVVFMPPTLIAGIYGMNFEHMPELDWTLGYPLAWGLILASAILPYWVAKRSGWL